MCLHSIFFSYHLTFIQPRTRARHESGGAIDDDHLYNTAASDLHQPELFLRTPSPGLPHDTLDALQATETSVTNFVLYLSRHVFIVADEHAVSCSTRFGAAGYLKADGLCCLQFIGLE
jgi:hypothetical protein